MNFDFNEDQKMLKETAQRFLADKCTYADVRKILEGDAPYDKALWQGLAEMGFMGAAIPEEFGGLGLGHLELCVIAEELGRAVAPVPFSSTVYLAAEALMLAGSNDVKGEWLPKIAAGETIGCMAVAEGNTAPTAKNIACAFDGSTLTGEKVAVIDGDVADIAIVIAKTGKGTAAVLVDLNGDGVEKRTQRTMDPTRSVAALSFKGAPATLLGADGDGWDIKEKVFDRAAVLLAFEQVGGSEAALEMAKAYSLERFAFGRQIASYQALKHKMADMYINNTLARSNAYYGAWALSTDAPELPLAAAGCRAAASDAYHFASKENIQVHGGIGFTWEADTQFHYRRSRLTGLQLGATRVWKDKLVTELEKKNAA